MERLDLKKQYAAMYRSSARQVQVLELPSLNFLMVDGAIEPGHGPGTSPLFHENVQALYGTAYTLKFMLKQRVVDALDYSVMALEGLWWVEDGHFDIQVKDNWHYCLMILQPEVVTAELLAEALEKLRKKKGEQPALARLRLDRFCEGLAMQMLHVGPYETEPETVKKMDAFAAQHGYQKCGLHHEIYLGDPLRAQPEKLKTILRHPVMVAEGR